MQAKKKSSSHRGEIGDGTSSSDSSSDDEAVAPPVSATTLRHDDWMLGGTEGVSMVETEL